jgi:hypothetical protein
MTINPNYTIKDTSTPKVQMKHWGHGQLRLNKQHILSPKLPQVTKSVLESRQKSMKPTPSENTQNYDISTYITTYSYEDEKYIIRTDQNCKIIR